MILAVTVHVQYYTWRHGRSLGDGEAMHTASLALGWVGQQQELKEEVCMHLYMQWLTSLLQYNSL